jgi:hypothetical protein
MGCAPGLVAQQYCVSGTATSGDSFFRVGDPVAITAMVTPGTVSCTTSPLTNGFNGSSTTCTGSDTINMTSGSQSWTVPYINPFFNGSYIQAYGETDLPDPTIGYLGGGFTIIAFQGQTALASPPQQPGASAIVGVFFYLFYPVNLLANGTLPSTIPTPAAVNSAASTYIQFAVSDVSDDIANDTASFSYAGQICAGTCASAINTALSGPTLAAGNTLINATFTPASGYSLAQAAQVCGFVNFDWQQVITSLPSPSPYKQVGNPTPLTAPPPFLDPPPRGYTFELTADNSYPLFYDPATQLVGPDLFQEDTYTLYFSDRPGDSCLFGGLGLACGGLTAPAGKQLAFTTHLVGIMAGCTAPVPITCVQDTGIGFSWASTFNWTSGGVSTTKNTSPSPPDPGGGTGGITITNVNTITTYNYPRSNTSPPLTLLVGQVSVVASGLAYSRVSQTFNGTVTITNISGNTIAGPFQIVFDSLTAGVTLTNATSKFGGWSYVTVPTVENLAPRQSASAAVQFRNPSNGTINFAPVPYSGSFN